MQRKTIPCADVCCWSLSSRAFTHPIMSANAYHGYLHRPEHHALGGYETWRADSSCLKVDAPTKIIAGLEELFEM